MRLSNIKCKVTTTVTRTASNQIPKQPNEHASVCIVDNDGVAGAVIWYVCTSQGCITWCRRRI